MNFWRILLLFFIGAACFIWGRKSIKIPEPIEKITIIRDTITRVKPVYIASAPVIRYDTLRLRDTIAVPVPIERRVYADSNYRAVVSGWHPSLDSISVYPATKIVTRWRERVEKERSRWGLGIQAGAGLSANGVAVPYVGVGVQYNLFSW